MPPSQRLEYPDNHIEVDNRLAWFLGVLGEKYPDARFVHLVRDREAVAQSFLKRWKEDPPPWKEYKNPIIRAYRKHRERHPGPGIILAFAHPIIARPAPWNEEQRIEICRFYYDTVNANIAHFLRDKCSMEVRIENIEDDFQDFWSWIGAEGDYDAAIAEFSRQHNVSSAEEQG